MILDMIMDNELFLFGEPKREEATLEGATWAVYLCITSLLFQATNDLVLRFHNNTAQNRTRFALQN